VGVLYEAVETKPVDVEMTTVPKAQGTGADVPGSNNEVPAKPVQGENLRNCDYETSDVD